MWGGFALGVVLTGDQPPDPSFNKKTPTKAPGPTTSLAPWNAGGRGGMGLMASGAW
jgi:hypothetical protein